jgi:hypothetical protein
MPLHAYGVIDFAHNAPALGSSPDILSSAPIPAPVGVTGGPPAYLEAHGIRYVPCADPHLGSDPYDAGPNPLFVPMADPDSAGTDGPLDSQAGGAAYVSPRELNARVDDRIRKFLELQSAPSARSFAPPPQAGRPHAGPPGPLGAPSSVDQRLKDLRRDCEIAASAASPAAQARVASSARGQSDARLLKLHQEAVRVSGGGRRGKGRAYSSGYDF